MAGDPAIRLSVAPVLVGGFGTGRVGLHLRFGCRLLRLGVATVPSPGMGPALGSLSALSASVTLPAYGGALVGEGVASHDLLVADAGDVDDAEQRGHVVHVAAEGGTVRAARRLAVRCERSVEPAGDGGGEVLVGLHVAGPVVRPQLGRRLDRRWPSRRRPAWLSRTTASRSRWERAHAHTVCQRPLSMAASKMATSAIRTPAVDVPFACLPPASAVAAVSMLLTVNPPPLWAPRTTWALSNEIFAFVAPTSTSAWNTCSR